MKAACMRRWNKLPRWCRAACIALAGICALMCFAQPLLTKNECAAIIALGERGKPYVLGAYGPVRYDCSGMVMKSYRDLGMELMHSAKIVGYDEGYPTISSPLLLRSGDLVFFDTVSDSDSCDHVGFYLGMGRFVHASSSEGRVMVSRLDKDWLEKFSWGKRIL